ncbi:MAG TPA: SpoIIE family protein phosphatase [Streptosporangiaceae bacterium]|nr:SpoIIE family protein phosphatase [Streptosporangiaceae bacterium]
MGLMQSPFCVVILDTEPRIVWANEAAEHLGDGIPATKWPGRRLGEVLPNVDVDLIEQSLRRVLATGKPVADLEVSSHAGSDPTDERFWSCAQFRIGGPDGKPAGVAHMMWEVTERARSQRRLALADEASARIGTTLDITRTAEELLDVAIPRLADAGTVHLLATVIKGDQLAQQARDQKMRLRRVALRWPAGPPTTREYVRNTWTETAPAKLFHQRLVAGLPVCLPTFGAMTEEQIGEVDSGAGLDRLMAAHAAGAHSMMIVPLTARGVIMGIVALYRLAGSKPYTLADLSLACGFASRAAVPLDNARLYTRERATALALQRGLLPRQIPSVPGLQLAYRYVPAEATVEIGGDWFDVIPLPQGRCALIVGDVTGHGMPAASLMGQLRTATRTLATFDHLTPAQVLTRLDQITADLTDAETSATCLYAVHDPATGTCDIARAGHPLPAIARPGHPTTFPALPPGLPLGTGTGIGDGRYQATRLHVPPGSTLLLYTDGLIENRATGISAGMARLARTLQTATTLPLTQACDTLLATLAPSPADDIAILMART